MNFKKSKEDIVEEAKQMARIRLQNQFANMYYQMSNSSLSNFNNIFQSYMSNLEWVVADAIGESIRTVVDNVYTDAEFEEDLTLRETNEHKQ